MSRAHWPVLWKIVLPAALAAAGLFAAWSLDQTSIERANRLYRAGAFADAAKIYADHLGRNPEAVTANMIRYNLGTALLGMGDAGASQALGGVGLQSGLDIHVRALNNLGLWRIIEASKALGQSRARVHAVGAVEAYKAALRLQPGHSDAGWNLAIAVRMLASIDAGDYQDGGAPVDGGDKREGDAPPSDDPADPSDQEEEQDAGVTAGEGETAAQAGADTPLSKDEAARILGTEHRDPTKMVGKLMAFEGRALRQRSSGRPSENEPK